MSVELSKDLTKLAGGAIVVGLVVTGGLGWLLGLGILLLGGVVTLK